MIVFLHAFTTGPCEESTIDFSGQYRRVYVCPQSLQHTNDFRFDLPSSEPDVKILQGAYEGVELPIEWYHIRGVEADEMWRLCVTCECMVGLIVYLWLWFRRVGSLFHDESRPLVVENEKWRKPKKE